MIEILFTESAAGSMKVAKDVKSIVGSSTATFIFNDDGDELISEKIAQDQAIVEEEHRKKLENAVSMEGNYREVVCFPLNLSMGNILGPFSDERADFLQSLVLIEDPHFDDIGWELMQTARRSLEQVLSAVERGLPVRIWYSRNPDEFCGFCHLLTRLPKNAEVRVVELPEYEVLGNELRTYSGWGEMDPMELGRFQSLERFLTDAEKRYFSGLWKKLQSENGPLRAVVNGQLCTVEADFYDSFILRELDRQPMEFHEARLVGTILGKDLPGLSDSLVALRIEEFISRGMLMPVTAPGKNHPIYHRFLRKEG